MQRKITDLHKKNIVVFDLEIKNSIDGTNITWSNFDKMGISVGCLYDYMTGENHVYLDDNIEELYTRLNSAGLVVGFNTTGFDNKLLAATRPDIRIDFKNYDILTEVRKSTGQSLPKGCKLNDVLKATFNMQKTEDGADAPKFYQAGQIGKLISYGLSDVRRERLCFEYAYVHGLLKTPTHGDHPMRNAIEMYEATTLN